MYRYDEFDHKIVTDRVNQFRGQVNRRVLVASYLKMPSSLCGL